MTNPSAAQKRKKKREQKLLEEEARQVEKERTPHVSSASPPPVFAAPVLVPSRSALDAWYPAAPPAIGFQDPAHWPADIHALVYGSTTPADVLGSLDDLSGSPTIGVIDTAPSAYTLRDLSALRSEGAHPWRTVRRRNHRLLPQRREQRPFPKSRPKRTIISAPRAPVLAVHDDLPIPPPSPLPPTSIADVSYPSPTVIPTLPAQTSYGVVRSSLALACTNEKVCIDGIYQLFDTVWGPDATDTEKNLLLELPGDQLVFLCMLAEFVVLEPVFAEFLHPAIANFANGWVTHCLQDSVGYG